jgi:hypothetical protein
MEAMSADVDDAKFSAPLQDDHIQNMVNDSLDSILRATITTALIVTLSFGALLSFGGAEFIDIIANSPGLIGMLGASVVIWVMLLSMQREREELNARVEGEIEALKVRERERLELDLDEFLEAVKDPLAKEVDSSGRLIYLTRGKSPRGMAIGGGAETFTPDMLAKDGWEVPAEHVGLEDKLTKAETVVVEADDIRAERAAKSWSKKEENDPELIEAGVKRLGDLVSTGHFGSPLASQDEAIDSDDA